MRAPSLTSVMRQRRRGVRRRVRSQLAVARAFSKSSLNMPHRQSRAIRRREYPVLMSVALEDGLHDQFARIAGHRPFHAGQRRGDDRCHLVVAWSSSVVDGPLRGPGRHHSDFEEHVLLARGNRSRTAPSRHPAALQISATVVFAYPLVRHSAIAACTSCVWSRVIGPAEKKRAADHGQRPLSRDVSARMHSNSEANSANS